MGHGQDPTYNPVEYSRHRPEGGGWGIPLEPPSGRLLGNTLGYT